MNTFDFVHGVGNVDVNLLCFKTVDVLDVDSLTLALNTINYTTEKYLFYKMYRLILTNLYNFDHFD